MGFETTKAEPDTEPVSLEEAKAQCEVDHDDRDDWFETRITAARKLVEQHTSRVFAECEVTYRVNDFPRRECEYTDGVAALRLPLWPVGSVDSVSYYDSNDDEQTLTEGDDYLVFLGRVPTLVYPAPGTFWPTVKTSRLGAVTVTFTAAADPETPLAKTAMLGLIEYWWVNRGSGDDPTGSDPTQAGIPAGVLRIMNSLTRPMYT